MHSLSTSLLISVSGRRQVFLQPFVFRNNFCWMALWLQKWQSVLSLPPLGLALFPPFANKTEQTTKNKEINKETGQGTPTSPSAGLSTYVVTLGKPVTVGGISAFLLPSGFFSGQGSQ